MAMRSSIATYRESLSRIAGEVDDAAADEFAAAEQAPPRGAVATPPSSGRRRRHPRPPSVSPVAPVNGIDSAEHDEIAKYKADIQKLQASEAEIKALSFNYAAILKEKEEQLSRLREENGSLRRSLDSSKASSNGSNGTLERSPSRGQTHAVQENSLGSSRPNGYSSGISQAVQLNGVHKMSVLQKGDEIEENNTTLVAVQASFENEIKQLKLQLDNEREKATGITKKLEDENKQNESLWRQLNELKLDKERTSTDIEELREQLNEKVSELRHLQDKLSKRDNESISEGSIQSLKSVVMALQKENAELKLEKGRLEADLSSVKTMPQKNDNDDSEMNRVSDLQKVTEEMALSITSLKKMLQDASFERDKALQDLARLKQHLLDKDLEDSEKMDEDSRLIEELRANCEQQSSHIVQLERALRLEIAKREESKKTTNEEFQKSKQIIDDLRHKLANSMSALESKNVELLNLQTALGQYYAESEAKERLGGDLAMAREELAKLSESLKMANQGIEISRREKEGTAAKLLQTERMLADGKRSMQKLEEDNSRLRRALEQSMTTLNRMSLDSDNYVDRRIVIKLLVTYFQRNHSKEVLDLMVRMLGFSEEDKQRIGFAQNTPGKGVVRGVLGLPGRIVGGIIGGHSANTATQASPDNQSFADLWVDFLLKETEEREKRESSEAARLLQEKSQAPSTSDASSPQPSDHPANPAPLPSTRAQPFVHSDAEFEPIPLTSRTSSSHQTPFSRPPPR